MQATTLEMREMDRRMELPAAGPTCGVRVFLNMKTSRAEPLDGLLPEQGVRRRFQ
jgi:hypothetical protein